LELLSKDESQRIIKLLRKFIEFKLQKKLSIQIHFLAFNQNPLNKKRALNQRSFFE